MPQLVFSPSARQDLSDIFDYIAQDKPIAAANWIDTIEQKCRLLASTPELGEERHEYGAAIRSSLVGRYVLFYKPSDKGIEILRIIPGDRDIRGL